MPGGRGGCATVGCSCGGLLSLPPGRACYASATHACALCVRSHQSPCTAAAQALDAAKGMLALHAHTPPIIHRDLKGPNLVRWRVGRGVG